MKKLWQGIAFFAVVALVTAGVYLVWQDRDLLKGYRFKPLAAEGKCADVFSQVFESEVKRYQGVITWDPSAIGLKATVDCQKDRRGQIAKLSLEVESIAGEHSFFFTTEVVDSEGLAARKGERGFAMLAAKRLLFDVQRSVELTLR